MYDMRGRSHRLFKIETKTNSVVFFNIFEKGMIRSFQTVQLLDFVHLLIMCVKACFMKVIPKTSYAHYIIYLRLHCQV